VAERRGLDHGLYPGNVLIEKEERRHFESDMPYRDAYKNVYLRAMHESEMNEPRATTAVGVVGAAGPAEAAADGNTNDMLKSRGKGNK